jgi:phage/plasmid primase-like uncharacterized protein
VIGPHQCLNASRIVSRTTSASNRPPFDVQAAWEAGEPATEAHGYITRKQGNPAGLRVYRGPERIAGQALDGALMVPAWDFAGKLATLQFIPSEGKKLNAPSGSCRRSFRRGP